MFKRKFDETLSSYKSKIKQNRDEGKANNEEFVRVLNAVMNGETSEVDNSVSHPEIIWNAKNLMALYAGPEPSKFGRKLAVDMFGEKETSLLKTQIIGPLKGRHEARTPVSEEARHTFEGFFQPTNNSFLCFSFSCFFLRHLYYA